MLYATHAQLFLAWSGCSANSVRAIWSKKNLFSEIKLQIDYLCLGCCFFKQKVLNFTWWICEVLIVFAHLAILSCPHCNTFAKNFFRPFFIPFFRKQVTLPFFLNLSNFEVSLSFFVFNLNQNKSVKILLNVIQFCYKEKLHMLFSHVCKNEWAWESINFGLILFQFCFVIVHIEMFSKLRAAIFTQNIFF